MSCFSDVLLFRKQDFVFKGILLLEKQNNTEDL